MARLFFTSLFYGRASVVVPLRPSSEHILIVRAPGAEDHTGFPIYLSPSWWAARLTPPTARVQRGSRDRALREQRGFTGPPVSLLTALSAGSYNLFTFLPTTG